MRLLFATDEFQYAGLQLGGFPLLIDSNGEVLEPFFSFLTDHLLENGSVQSKGSWPTYGYGLLHYIRYLDASARTWDEKRVVGVPSVVAGYRTWALQNGTDRTTTLSRLDLICRFYVYAIQHGLISRLPYEEIERTVALLGGEMPGAGSEVRVTPNVKFRKPKRNIHVLTLSEVNAFLAALKNPTHRLMAKLQLATGLRVEELVTFPAAYVVDPRTNPQTRRMFAVTLDPTQMRTKGSVERVIHVPTGLMAELWAYMAVERNRRAGLANAGRQAALFLTEEGTQFATRSVWEIYTSTKDRIGIHVNPHALRHTYATHTLAALSKVRNMGSALLYVCNRLGHSSVITTQMYCHYVDDVAENLVADYQAELFEALEELD